MSKVFDLKTAYGLHLSKCFDVSLMIDPLLPPKKCPLNCIYCPLGETVVKTSKPKVYVDSERVINDLVYFMEENGVVFKTVYIWGCGDPLLNYHLPIVVENICSKLNDIGFKGKLIVKTSGVLLGSNWVKPLFKHVDEIVIPMSIPYSYWIELVEPVGEYKLSSIVDSLKNIIRENPGKISIEVTLFRYRDFTNAEESVLSELIAILHNFKSSRIYVKTVNRPSRSLDTKPVRGELFRRAVEKLSEEGFETSVCNKEFETRFSLKDIVNNLFNLISRIPLSTDEIIKIYGSNTLMILEKSTVNKINWNNRVYFQIRRIHRVD